MSRKRKTLGKPDWDHKQFKKEFNRDFRKFDKILERGVIIGLPRICEKLPICHCLHHPPCVAIDEALRSSLLEMFDQFFEAISDGDVAQARSTLREIKEKLESEFFIPPNN